ncbi:MAG: UDP-N-acetylmuramate dehydrogenase [Candidatus Omnitrophica bacterium]|nr:UDP-N-acetylmuramate dehydrogenase [Candidatus Omnitrophota bacterium]
MNWWKELKGRVSLNEPLSAHTGFKTGGPARFFVEPKDDLDLRLLFKLARKNKLPVAVIGAGSNLLVADKGVKKIVVRLSSPYFRKVVFNGDSAQARAGTRLNRLIRSAREKGLSGFEFLTGIPGTVGGALWMNAGISEKNEAGRIVTKSIGELVENVTLMDYNGRIKSLDKARIKFGYRKAGFPRCVILSARFKLRKAGKKEISAKVLGYLSRRKLSQDLSFPSCGCAFKNPRGNKAGRLIDLCGLKGKKLNGAAVSRKHANFILNSGGAKSRDILKLMELIKKEVKNKFNITLKPEIKIWN